MGKDTFKYILVCMSFYMTLAAAEVFLLDPLLDFIVQGFWPHFWVDVALILTVNPILTWKVADRFKWKETKEYGDDLL